MTLGPKLVLSSAKLKKIKQKKVSLYVASLMGATLSREKMATHSYKVKVRVVDFCDRSCVICKHTYCALDAQ